MVKVEYIIATFIENTDDVMFSLYDNNDEEIYDFELSANDVLKYVNEIKNIIKRFYETIKNRDIKILKDMNIKLEAVPDIDSYTNSKFYRIYLETKTPIEIYLTIICSQKTYNIIKKLLNE